MSAPYAEVIGDPIAQSKSPLIHGFWLKALGIEGDPWTIIGMPMLPLMAWLRATGIAPQ